MNELDAGLFGSGIREQRRQAELTVDQLAMRARLHHTVVNKVELGKNEPALDTALKLAHSLGVTLAEILERSRRLEPT